MDDTPNLNLPYIMAAQAQKHVTHNEAIRALDAILQLAVLDKDLATPPVGPAEGDRYIVASGATGAWTAHEGAVAAFQDGAWTFYAPVEGWLAWAGDEDALYAWDGTAWVPAGAPSLNPVPLVGVNATADAANRLSVSAPATLLNHEGAGHQLKVNKSAGADTASLLFQTGFSGRAEMGLAGDDDFRVKVSPDGTTWREAVVVDNETGRVAVAAAAPLARFHVNMADADNGLAFLMTGYAVDGTNDPDYGACIAMGHNTTTNRQIVLADSESGYGVRVLGSNLDGYNFILNDRADMSIGNDSTTLGIVSTDVSIRNPAGESASAPANLVTLRSWPTAPAAGMGVALRSSLRTSTDHIEFAAHGLEMICTDGTLDAEYTAFVFKVMALGSPPAERARIDADGLKVSGWAEVKSYTVGTLPSAAGAGRIVFVSDEAGGAVLAFSDGTNWRRVTDRAVVS